jgi:ubiquinone/menaquinone biosynthesis C-methylase UbiE
MLKISETRTTAIPDHAGVKTRGKLGSKMLPLTRRLRINAVKSLLGEGERLLDIGCAQGYFLREISGFREKIGMDILMGEDADNPLPFPDKHFDVVTMLAVIEHLHDPVAAAKEIHRVLQPGGKWIFTTPKQAAEKFIRFYASNVDDQHSMYFDEATVKDKFGSLFEIREYKTFIFGLNQLFSLQKLG